MMNGIGGSMGLPSMEMMSRMRAQMFTKADADGSGGIDAAEFTGLAKNAPAGAVSGSDPAEEFARVDTDGNGSVTQSELDARMEALFADVRPTAERFGADAGGTSSNLLQQLLDALGGDAASKDGAGSPKLLERLASQLEQRYGGGVASRLAVTA